jgi:hypothetical protein
MNTQPQALTRRALLQGTALRTTAGSVWPPLGLVGRCRAFLPPKMGHPRSEPNAKRGGVLRAWYPHNAPSHFDIHQSGTVGNMGAGAV